MVVGNCQSCRATCKDPGGTDNCRNVCSNSDTCICPDGYLMNDGNCIPKEDCPCFSVTAASVIPVSMFSEGSSHLDSQCRMHCVCRDSVLSCESNYTCHVNAVCENRDAEYRCYCQDGLTCARDCWDVYINGFSQSGIYKIYPNGWPDQHFDVYCNMDDGGGWTVFQRRFDGHVDFFLNWESYEQGFGSVDSEFWLGNEKLYYLTNQKWYELRIDMKDKYDYDLYATYSYFKIEGSSANYSMSHLGNYSGSESEYRRTFFYTDF
ncbi:Fibrinogen C domain-containing protein 1 [Holothuria leucospilota]|uniref:Fibrinogen C domain-containing protein 1 n=1 Tax=Holothuria leucospilota TaxID=206669 RepID=A0A9Q1BV40_HOLLE|nr:Fibrinogen C domain-containing protein 1 [Holothuria leucospilota]